ncbi:hypothetical protein PTKIN_Ptkin05aG0140800 [Pterospermum kingtungense]
MIRFLSSRAQILSNRWGNILVVLGGNFNSTPQSAIYKFLPTSEIDEEVKVATGSAENHLVVHLLKLSSSYATIKKIGIDHLALVSEFAFSKSSTVDNKVVISTVYDGAISTYKEDIIQPT